MRISQRYDWLGSVEGAPKMIKEAVVLGQLNTTEFPGPKSNPEIMALAAEAGLSDIYKSDETAWCAVAHAVIALRAGKIVPFKGYERLRASSFQKFGSHVDVPMFGDTLVFSRPGGFHVGLYIGEDNVCYHVAGGNQSNQYCVTRILKGRLLEARRPEYKSGTPAGVKRIFLESEGMPSSNEA